VKLILINISQSTVATLLRFSAIFNY